LNHALVLLALLLSSFSAAAGSIEWGAEPEVSADAESDWAYPFSESAVHHYEAKERPFPCASLSAYVTTNSPTLAYRAVRDAGIFQDRGCAREIEAVRAALQAKPLTRMALVFYRYRLGDSAALKSLVEVFESEALPPVSPVQGTDHLLLELLGFSPEWEKTGPLLIRHLHHSDGAAAELSGSALDWKRFLWAGDPALHQECLKLATREQQQDPVRFCSSPLPPS
jgi:hypothetical protein